ncbi:cytochrome c [Shewanella psychropiezotolerans]|uniref:Cytochrome c n=1 Tax=Shewanella psychropiezotolerans TaxID=2593655 RepID=A0ABX5WZW6_9GAMM|nr:cytochrome c [Shewanella psychropiezotolerans]QDO84656.1 cytochrome c [Shewanella psychropiezotolerans]
MKYSLSIIIICATLSPNAIAEVGKFEHEIEERKTSFTQIEDLNEQIKINLKSDDIPWPVLQANTDTLLAASSSLSNLFPQGSHENSRAKQKIWNTPAKFKNELALMDSHFRALNNAVLQKDTHAAKLALKKANSTCSNCHRKYRSWW